jgi:hypothetical protein
MRRRSAALRRVRAVDSSSVSSASIIVGIFRRVAGELDDVRRRTWLGRETYRILYRILYITHVWPAATVTQNIVHNHAVRKLEINDECVQVGVRVADERAHEGLCDFMRTKERREEGAILRRRSTKYVPANGSLEVYRATQPDTSISISPPMPTRKRMERK